MKRRSATSLILYLLIITALVVAAGLNLYLYIIPFSNSILILELSPADEVIISNNQTNNAIFIISPYNIVYKEDDFETVLLKPNETLVTTKENKFLLSYSNSPYQIIQSASNPFTNVKINTHYGDTSRKLLITQSVILEEPLKSQTSIVYSGIYVFDVNKLSIKELGYDTISLSFEEEPCSYKIKVEGGKFAHIDEQFNLIVFEIQRSNIEYKISYACNEYK